MLLEELHDVVLSSNSGIGLLNYLVNLMSFCWWSFFCGFKVVSVNGDVGFAYNSAYLGFHVVLRISC